MANIPADLKYTKDHEWFKMVDGKAVMGITDYAQHAMGDIVYVELPEVGTSVKAHADFVVVESVKGANDVFSPVSGTVCEVNVALDDSPELLNADAYVNWIAKLEDVVEPDDLLDATAYAKLVADAEAAAE